MTGATITNGYITLADGSRVKHRYYKKENPRGKILEVGGTRHPWVILSVKDYKVSMGPWTWVARVVSWNPCNSLELASGIWQ